MLFSEPAFFGFFAIVFGLYYLPPLRGWQVPLLVAASFGFYAYGQPYLLLLLLISAMLSAATSYVVMVSSRQRAKQAWAIAGVALNLAILGFFKYGGLIERSFSAASWRPTACSGCCCPCRCRSAFRSTPSTASA